MSDSPVDTLVGKAPQFLTTYDWRFTESAQRTFQDRCYDAVVDAQVKGKGYFMEAEGYKLEKALIDGVHEADYVKVANYAMMLYTQQQVEKEKQAWSDRLPNTSETIRVADDELF